MTTELKERAERLGVTVEQILQIDLDTYKAEMDERFAQIRLAEKVIDAAESIHDPLIHAPGHCDLCDGIANYRIEKMSRGW